MFKTHILDSLEALKTDTDGWLWCSNTGRLVLKKTSAWASTLNMGLINKGWYGMLVACGIWCFADVLSISSSLEQTGEFIPYQQVFVDQTHIYDAQS